MTLDVASFFLGMAAMGLLVIVSIAIVGGLAICDKPNEPTEKPYRERHNDH